VKEWSPPLCRNKLGKNHRDDRVGILSSEAPDVSQQWARKFAIWRRQHNELHTGAPTFPLVFQSRRRLFFEVNVNSLHTVRRDRARILKRRNNAAVYPRNR